MVIDSQNNSIIADDNYILAGNIDSDDVKIYKDNSFIRNANDEDMIIYREEIKMLNILLDCKRERKEK